MPGRLPLFTLGSRSATIANPQPLRPFLIEIAVEHETVLSENRIQGDYSIQSIGAMCDEDVEATDLVLKVGGDRYPFDRRYLARIWPGLFKLPQIILVDRSVSLMFAFPGQAVVVIAGVRNPN